MMCYVFPPKEQHQSNKTNRHSTLNTLIDSSIGAKDGLHLRVLISDNREVNVQFNQVDVISSAQLFQNDLQYRCRPVSRDNDLDRNCEKAPDFSISCEDLHA
jgi:hypothetical protein